MSKNSASSLHQNQNSLPDAINEPRSNKDQKVQAKRMSISLAGDMAQQLEDLAAIQGVSQNEVLRRALATEAYIQAEVAKGSTVLVQKKDGSIREVIFR